MSNIRRVLAGVLLGLLPASAAFGAAKLTIIPTYAGSLDPNTGNPVGTKDLSSPSSAAFIHQIDLRFQLEDLDTVAPNTDMGFILFNIPTQAHLTYVDPGGGPWQGFNQGYDSNGPAFGGTRTGIYSNNSDPGNDLLGITVQIGQFDAQNRQVGEQNRPVAGSGPDTLGYPSLLGSIFVQWDGQGSPSLVTTPIPGSFLGLYPNNDGSTTPVVAQADAQYSSGSVQFGTVPEPASLSLIGLSALPLLRRRRKA
jgi:hypothetical protein